MHLPLALVSAYLDWAALIVVLLVTINILFLSALGTDNNADPPNFGPGCVLIILFVFLNLIGIGVFSMVVNHGLLFQGGFLIAYMVIVTAFIFSFTKVDAGKREFEGPINLQEQEKLEWSAYWLSEEYRIEYLRTRLRDLLKIIEIQKSGNSIRRASIAYMINNKLVWDVDTNGNGEKK